MGKKSFVVGAVAATGAILLIPGVAAAVARAGRPFLRTAFKSGSSAFDEFKQAGAEAYEHFEDVFQEVRAEMKEESAMAAEAASPATEEPEPRNG